MNYKLDDISVESTYYIEARVPLPSGMKDRNAQDFLANEVVNDLIPFFCPDDPGRLRAQIDEDAIVIALKIEEIPPNELQELMESFATSIDEGQYLKSVV